MEELRSMSSRLAKMKEEPNPHGLPPTDFRDLPDRVLTQLEKSPDTPGEKAKAGKYRSLGSGRWWRREYTVGIAASLLLAILLLGLPPSGGETGLDSKLAELPAEDIDLYIEQNIHEFDSDLLSEALSENSRLEWFPADELPATEIEEYLDGRLYEMEEEFIIEELM